jgi:PTS system mannose-specific IIA component
MFGALIVAHDSLAGEMKSVLEAIVGKTEGILEVSIDWEDDHESGINKIGENITKLKDYNGVVIFTDMFGGTPTNISLPFLEKDKIEIITGVNLPMLIKFVNLQAETKKKLSEIVLEVRDRAQQSIKVPSEIYYDVK